MDGEADAQDLAQLEPIETELDNRQFNPKPVLIDNAVNSDIKPSPEL
jgi:hypothetical protein